MARVILALLALAVAANGQQFYDYAKTDTTCSTGVTAVSPSANVGGGTSGCLEATTAGKGTAAEPWIYTKATATYDPTSSTKCADVKVVVNRWKVTGTLANKPADADGCTAAASGDPTIVAMEDVTFTPGSCATINTEVYRKLVCPDISTFALYGFATADTTCTADPTATSGLSALATSNSASCKPVPGLTDVYAKITIAPAVNAPGTCVVPATGTSFAPTGTISYHKTVDCSDASPAAGSVPTEPLTFTMNTPGTKPVVGTYSACEDAVVGTTTSYIRLGCQTASSSSCFSAGSKVTVEDGSEVAIEDVEIGQRVLAVDKFGKTFYDRVFRITHHDHVSTINYVRLTTSEGSVLELSGNHYLHVNACCDLNNVVLADDVKVGDTVFVMKAGSETAAPVAVTKKENVLKQGAFNVHVLNGNIVVNGVVATHFTTESAWQNNNAATAWYHVQDAVYRVTGMAPRPE